MCQEDDQLVDVGVNIDHEGCGAVDPMVSDSFNLDPGIEIAQSRCFGHTADGPMMRWSGVHYDPGIEDVGYDVEDPGVVVDDPGDGSDIAIDHEAQKEEYGDGPEASMEEEGTREM